MKVSKTCYVAMLLLVFVFVARGFSQTPDKFKHESLYSDFKARQIGDIVTILIIESATGARQSNVNSSDKASVNASGSITGNLTSFLPLLGASSEFENDHAGAEGTSQKDLLTGKITAVVTEITEGGNLILQGQRHLEVNGETHILKLKGTVRPRDINSENMVFSYNLANVEIAYKKDGFMNKIGKPGWVARWSSWLMLLGLGAAAYVGVSAAN